MIVIVIVTIDDDLHRRFILQKTRDAAANAESKARGKTLSFQ